jgi:hypothetical protein
MEQVEKYEEGTLRTLVAPKGKVTKTQSENEIKEK